MPIGRPKAELLPNEDECSQDFNSAFALDSGCDGDACSHRTGGVFVRRWALSWLSGRRNPRYPRSSCNRHCASATAELAVSRKYPLEKVNFERLHLSTNTLCL